MKASPILLIFAIFFAMLIAGCADMQLSIMATNYQSNEVEFVPTGSGGSVLVPNSMQVYTLNQNCPTNRNPHNGCMFFEKNKTGNILFSIKGNPKVKKCADNGTIRVITKIELTSKSSSNSIAIKGDFSGINAGNPLPDWVKDKAFPELELNTGIAYFEADVNDGLTNVKLTNLNHNKFSDGIKSVWYRVTVTHCTDPTNKNWRADPRVDNRGGTY